MEQGRWKRMIEAIDKILKPLDIPVGWNIKPEIGKKRVSVVYHFFNQRPSLYGDGQGSDESGSVQVDVYSKCDYTAVVESIKTLMKDAGLKLADSRDSFDSLKHNDPAYHKILIFNYLKSEVKI